jgi:hypothetical protein
MDGSEFLSRDNIFRHSFSSLEKTSSQKRVKGKESPGGRVKRSSSHRSADSIDVSQIKNLVHQLHTSLNATEEQGKTRKSEKVRALATGGPYMSTNVTKEEKEDHGTEPTTPSSSPRQSKEKKSRKARGDEKEIKRKKASKKHKKRKDHKLPPVCPPPEIDVSGNVTVASSIGGLSQFPQPRRHSGHCIEVPDRLLHPTSLHLYVSKPKTPLAVDVSQPMTVASSLRYGSVVHNNKIRASASRPARDGLLPRPPPVYHHSPTKSRCEIDIVVPANVPLESIFQAPREIDVSNPTIVSVLGESRHYS